MDIAARHNLHVVEDACQSHFATYKGKPVGSFGAASAFSFYPSKNLGACGDGGICTTNSADVDKLLRILRDHGQTGKYVHGEFGDNGRMDEIQAAALVRKIAHIDNWTRARQEVAALYIEQLSGIPDLRFQKVAPDKTHVYYMFVIRHPRREAIAAEFDKRGIGYAFRGITPLHLQKVFEGRYAHGSLPQVEQLMREMLALPIFPEMSREQILEVCDAVKAALK
jgi:dTDP-4-amino-4,6-dideoxygalactose transaminase